MKNLAAHVCDDSWEDVDGQVACRSLGLDFVRLEQASVYAGLKRPLCKFTIVDLSCVGTEATLREGQACSSGNQACFVRVFRNG